MVGESTATLSADRPLHRVYHRRLLHGHAGCRWQVHVLLALKNGLDGGAGVVVWRRFHSQAWVWRMWVFRSLRRRSKLPYSTSEHASTSCKRSSGSYTNALLTRRSVRRGRRRTEPRKPHVWCICECCTQHTHVVLRCAHIEALEPASSRYNLHRLKGAVRLVGTNAPA
jgi:hypothetical protein